MYSKDYKDSFLIQINEEQRKIINDALLMFDNDGPTRTKEQSEEVSMLLGLFSDLPNQENTYVRENGMYGLMTHGFCL